MVEKKPEIQHLKTSSLIPYARNARTHTEAQVAQIAASIREFGFTNPVLVKGDKSIIAGHGRVQAAQLLGLETIPCLVLGYLTDIQAKALAIADNKIPLNSGWDAELLKLEVEELVEAGVDMGLLAFNENELTAVFGSDLEHIEPQPGEASSGVDVKYLVVGKKRIPLDVDEARGLDQVLEAYVNETGSLFGFGNYLLRKIEDQ
jgi:ParB family transcriptional regulator, chromosome partitioning protein